MSDENDRGQDRFYHELASLIRDVRLFALAAFVAVVILVVAAAVKTC